MFDKNKVDLLTELVKTSFKLRYNNSILGFLWVLLKPFMLFLIMYFVWSRLLGNSQENYALYLLLGIMAFTFFNEGITMGMNALLDKAHIILKVNFPRQIALLSATMMALINLTVNLAIFFVFAIVSSKSSFTLGGVLYGLFIFLILYLFILGLSFFTSIILVYLRDLSSVTEVGMQLLFWATPIFYSLGAGATNRGVEFDDILKRAIGANPLGILINTARDAFISGQIENPSLMIAYFTAALVLCVIGWHYFSSKVTRVAEAF